MNYCNKKRLISDIWMHVDKTECIAGSQLLCENNEDKVVFKEKHISNILTNLRPFVPMTIEETSLTTSLENWSNSNVRLIGIIRFIEDKYWLESIKEDGTFRILLDFKHLTCVPLLNERVQIFGTMSIDECHSEPFVIVELFRNMESGDLCQYIEAVERMKKFIPLFIKSQNETTSVDTDSENEVGCSM